MKINVKDSKKISEELGKVQRLARVRTVDVSDIPEILKEVEKKLGIAKKYMIGIRFECDINAQHFSSAYKGTPESTHLSFERYPSGWFITKIYRENCWDRETRFEVELTEDAKKAIIRNNERF